MKKFTFVFCIAVFSTIQSFSQTTEPENTLREQAADSSQGWKTGGVITLSLSQTSLTNWAAGGQNSLAVNGVLSLFAHYKKGNQVWDNFLDLGYGQINKDNDKGENKWWKTDDKIDFTSKYGQKAAKNFYYAALLNVKTQWDAGYKYPDDSNKISGFLAPAYILGAIGMDYKPGDRLSVFAAPLTAKITVVNDQKLADAGAFGMEKATYDSLGNLITDGKNMKSEFGGYLRVAFNTKIMENITLQSKIDLFSNYLHNPQNIDINFETLISMKVNKYISATILMQYIYDDDTDIKDKNGNTGPRNQFKEILGVGFSYKF